MAWPDTARTWWLPGSLVTVVGVCFIVAGVLSGGPDLVGGIVLGAVFLLAAGVILWRRTPHISRPAHVITDIRPCSGSELQAQIAYLAATPVAGIARLLQQGRCTLRKGVVRSLAHLGALKTEFGQLGPLVPPVQAGEPKFRICEVAPLLRGHPGVGEDLLRAIDALLARDERDIEYNVTVMRLGPDLVIKDGNKRTIAYWERHRGEADPIDYPVFLVELVS